MHYNDFVKMMYAENCKERIAYGQKPYDDINYYESANYMFLTKKYKEKLTPGNPLREEGDLYI